MKKHISFHALYFVSLCNSYVEIIIMCIKITLSMKHILKTKLQSALQ